MTTAEQLNNQQVEEIPEHQFDPSTGIYTFTDGSRAKILTRLRECKPRITASLSTSSVESVYVWQLLV
jgi:hypothetical protein